MSKCAVRYVANAGLVLETEQERIGIDIFCRDTQKLYMDTPEWIRNELLGEIREGKLSTLIFTHEHEDHFCKEDVVAAWRACPGLRIISTERVAHMLEQEGVSVSGLMKAIRVEALPAGLWAIPNGECESQMRTIGLGKFRISFLNTLHEGAKYAGVQNLTLLVETAGMHMVIPGDAGARETLFARIAQWHKELDWFFLPFPYVGIPSARRLLVNSLELRQAFVLHQPRKEADVEHWVANAKAVCKKASDGLPQPWFPEDLGEWMQL